MKKLLAIFLSLTLLVVTVLSTVVFTATADTATTTDTWILFDAKEPFYEDPNWKVNSSTGLTHLYPAGMSCYAQPGYATIFKLKVSESGTLVLDGTGQNNFGCKNTGYQWVKGGFEFAILDKNGKVIYPTNGNPEELLLLEDNGTYTGEHLPIDLTVDVTAGDEFYFYHRNLTGSQANFQTKIDIRLNGTDINEGNDLFSVYNEQGAGGWYFMYAETSTIEITHTDPNGATDFGGDKYVATYTAQPMVKIEEGACAGYWGAGTTSDVSMVQWNLARPKQGESIIARFTAPADGRFYSNFFGVNLYTVRGSQYHNYWEGDPDGLGIDFFIVNQDGELLEPAYDGPSELRTPLGESSSINVGYFSYSNMKKGEYIDFVIVGANNPKGLPLSLGGDFYFDDGTTKTRYDDGSGKIFLQNNEEQGARNFQMFYATDVQVEKASTDAWLEYVRLDKPLTAAPATVEAWVNIPADVPDYRVGTLISDYESDATDGFTVSVENYGHPRVQYSNGTVGWTVDSVDLRTSTWQHIAFTVDAANDTLSFYLDGELKATKTVEGITAAASDRPAVIGNNLTYAPSTAFSGQVKKLAVFSDVRTADEIEADMEKVAATADGLIGYYRLSGEYTDKSPAANHGSVTTINTGYYDGELEAAEDEEFTIVQMGDQQMIASGFPYVMSSITQWIADNKDKLNIKAVVNVGDYVNQATETYQWEDAVDATKLLTDAKIPFLFAPGNHEYPGSGATVRDDQYLKANFPLADYFSQGAAEDNNVTTLLYAYPSTDKLADAEAVTDEMNIANAVYHVNLGGQDYFILALEYQTRKAVIDNWAKAVMEKLEADENYPNAKTIVITHGYIDNAGKLGDGTPSFTTDTANGTACYSTQEIYDNFVSQYESITMVLSGHVSSGVATRTDYGEHGNKITCVMTDFSYDGNGGEGVLMLYRFKADGTIKVETYSALREQFYREQYQFDLELEAEEINQYWLDFDEKQMPLYNGYNYYTNEYSDSLFAHNPANTYAVREYAAIRTLVAHFDGTLYFHQTPEGWAQVSGLSIADYCADDASVKFAITDDDGKILWPTDGKPLTMTKLNENQEKNYYLIEFSTPVKTGDKIHFVFFDASYDGVHVSCNAFGYIGTSQNDWFNGRQVTSGNFLRKTEDGYSFTDQDEKKDTLWYYNYAESISALTYNPNDPTEGVKLNYELNYGVRGEGGSINVLHNGDVVSAGKLSMNKGGIAAAHAIINPGYRIKSYYVNGVSVGRQSPYNLINISEDTLLEIEYEKVVVEGDANSDDVADICDLVMMKSGNITDKTVCDFVDPYNENIIDSADLSAFRKILLR